MEQRNDTSLHPHAALQESAHKVKAAFRARHFGYRYAALNRYTCRSYICHKEFPKQLTHADSLRGHTGWPRVNPSLLILLTSFVSDALSIACSDVLFDAHSGSAPIFYPRAKLEPVSDTVCQWRASQTCA